MTLPQIQHHEHFNITVKKPPSGTESFTSSGTLQYHLVLSNLIELLVVAGGGSGGQRGGGCGTGGGGAGGLVYIPNATCYSWWNNCCHNW